MTPVVKAALSIVPLGAIALLSGCSTTGHVSCMHDFQRDPNTAGQNPLCVVEIKKRISADVSLKYFHQSWLSSGWPVNENEESTADAVGIEVVIW